MRIIRNMVLIMIIITTISLLEINSIVKSEAVINSNNRIKIDMLIQDDLNQMIKKRMEYEMYLDSIKIENNRQNSISYNSDNLLEPTYIKAEELHAVLSGFSGGLLAEYA